MVKTILKVVVRLYITRIKQEYCCRLFTDFFRVKNHSVFFFQKLLITNENTKYITKKHFTTYYIICVNYFYVTIIHQC